jgi:GNAT superfamily N-acetyltransferase
MTNNYDRMIALAEAFFHAKDDPQQLLVNEDVMRKLRALHPQSLTQEEEADGPICWILVIPTTQELMHQFLARGIGEKELFDRTLPGMTYDALYLCSALVLPECRGKGVAKRLTLQAIQAIQRDHPIRHLFYWSFSEDGDRLAASVAKQVGLRLLKRVG